MLIPEGNSYHNQIANCGGGGAICHGANRVERYEHCPEHPQQPHCWVVHKKRCADQHTNSSERIGDDSRCCSLHGCPSVFTGDRECVNSAIRSVRKPKRHGNEHGESCSSDHTTH